MSTAPGLDVRPHMAAIKALIDATLSPHKSYGYDNLPGMNGTAGEVPAIFAVVSVERRFAGTPRMNGRPSRSGWRVSARWAGRTLNEALWAEERVTSALEGVKVTLDGQTSTPISHEVSQAAAYDDGRMVGLTEFTYVL